MDNPLDTYLRHQIAVNGGLSIADYMQACLVHPVYGYYMKGNPIGLKGDFVTAPEISQMFGELIGVWYRDLWNQMGQPASPHLIELGPGRGTLMQDLLRSFPEVLDIHMIEISPALQFEQQRKLHGHSIKWHTTVDQALNMCNKGPVFIIANEFFDALPIRQFQYLNYQWYERLINIEPQTDELCFSLKSSEPPINLLQASEGDIIEVSPLSHEIIRKIADKICKSNGAGLIIDYGYRTPTLTSTLQAVREHSYHNFLEDPGLADLTAHVNFAALIKEATQIGAKVYGPAFQGAFLMDLGIEIRAKMLQCNLSNSQGSAIKTALERLLNPDQMGTLFKVLAITGPSVPDPCGFTTSGYVSCSPLKN
ncbi:MAG: SAM-dependent methyltransferase [Alphaproteobacteria bacterium]|nr:SAM-dependent methyltransferase [Alphaproteobacteria bacterium]